MSKRASRASGPSAYADKNVDTQLSTNEILRQGQEAIEAYDYELARKLLEHAFTVSRGSTEAALALLTLLVDHLVADEDALALWPDLSSEARRASDVRLLLALAAARTGDVQRATHLVAGIDGSRAADVLSLLATNVLQSGDWAEAGRLAEDARTRDPAHPGARDVANRIADARAVARGRLEDEMAFALEDGNRQEAYRLAESIIALFPESAPARQIIRAATDEQRHDEAKQYVQVAEAALTRADLDTALQWLRRAEQVLVTTSGSGALRAHITILEAEAKARSTTVAVAEVSALLAKDTRSGLLRYASSQEQVRAEVRKTNSFLHLDTLERILQKRVKVDDAVGAVLDLVEAMDTVDRDPKSALDKIGAHERILAGIAGAAKVQSRARELLENERIRRVSEMLQSAQSAIDEGNAEGGLDRLGHIDPHDVRALERERMDVLRTEANAIMERLSLERRYEQLLSTDPLTACEVAEQLMARADSNPIQWQDAIAAARRNARRMFGVWVAEEPVDSAPTTIEGPVTIDLDAPLKLLSPLHETLQWIDSDAKTFALTESHDRWIFVRVGQVATGKIQLRVILRMPERVGQVDAMVTKSNTLSIVSDGAAVFEISLASWDPLFWRASHELVPNGEIVEHAKIVPDTRFVWVHVRRDDDRGRVRVVDAQRRRVTREIEDIWSFDWVVDSTGTRMICSGGRDRVTMHDMRGALIQERQSFANANVGDVVVHPSGQGLLAACGVDDELVEFEEIGCVPNPWGHKWAGKVEAWHPSVLATSLRRRNAYFIASMGDDTAEFEEMGFVDGGLRRRLQATFSATPHIVRDSANQNVLALFEDGLRLHIVPLTEQAPVVPAIHHRRVHVPNPFRSFGCNFSGDHGAETLRFVDSLPHFSPSTEVERLHTFATTMVTTPVDLFDTHRMLLSMKKSALASTLLSWMQQHLPSNLYTSLILAIRALEQGSLPEAMRKFEALPLDTIAEKHRQHVCHEFALALIRAGEFERALPVLHEGMLAGEDHCKLQDLLDLIEPLPDHMEDPNESILLRIRQTVQDCDFWLDEGQFVRAREAIDIVDIWEAGEVQSLARLATAYLQFDPRDEAERFRKAIALARFLGEHRASGSLRNELIIDAAQWSKSKLEEIEMQASKWLESLA